MKAKKYLKGGQVKLDANKDGKISGEDFSMLRGRKEMKSGGKVVKYKEGGLTPEEKKAKAAATADKKRELQDKLRIADKRVTKEAKGSTASLSRVKKKATGKGLTSDQKASTTGRLRRNPNLPNVTVRDNIKADLRNIQAGKEELAYVGRPDRYGDLATLKDKMYNTSKNKDGSYNRTRVSNIYNDFDGQAPKGAQFRPMKNRKR
jgi:hypothetical protein